MKKVYLSNAHINMTDYKQFGIVLQEKIDEIQNKGLQVEIQYCPCSIGDSQICVNALLLGYKMEED